ncbi:polysaccharide biosynthesis/export family protein [Amylibacter sp.]|nr:polysaccharide biosynthesis/export family protein [Amylibacter sp.]
MTRLKLIVCGIASALFLQNCSKILEPVSLFSSNQDVNLESVQEDFKINIEALTFKTAKKLNNARYSRQVILTGSGSRAKVLDEANFLKPSLPKLSSNQDYLLGVGDKLSFVQLNEFKTRNVRWPTVSKKPEYLLGAGDELTFVQSTDKSSYVTGALNGQGQFVPNAKRDELIVTKGLIGTNGNILLLGLGNILAANRTIDEVRTEVRNILIGNGLAPNFQLEISFFRSQNAFVSIKDGESKSISLNNLPISLKEVALGASLSKADKNFALIKFTRNAQEFHVTAEQLFDLAAPEIFIQDKDQIEIEVLPREETSIQTLVGSKGNILLPNIGSIPAVNLSVDDVHDQIRNILIEKGIKPNFQLELTKAVSKKAYLIQKNVGTTVVPLSSSKITLREIILGSESSIISTVGLAVITLKRNSQVFSMTGDYILDPNTPEILIVNNDQIEVESLAYKPGQVFALSGADNAQIVPIDPSKRETLADVLFVSGGALSNRLAKRSEVYLLRGRKPSFAYHLDTQNVSRILVAAQTELRPNDIVYVADRPIISFSRTLAEILPLRTLLKDIQDNNIP